MGWMKTRRDEGSPLLLREACAALGCSCVRSPPSESSRQGFYGSGELLSGLLAGMIAFRFRWLLLPASYLSQEREISLQLGGGVRAAPGCWQRGALGWRLSRFGKGSSAPTSGQGQWVTDRTSKPQICSFLPLLCSTDDGHPPAVAEAELGAASVLCAPLRGGDFAFCALPLLAPAAPPQGQAGLTALELPAPCLEGGALSPALKFCTFTWVFNIQTIREI